jgi:PGF-pre-PGF domain-containing protein
MNKLKSLFFLPVLFIFLGLVTPVSAQYDTNVVSPKYQDGGEVYGINITASQSATLFPQGCESIDKIVLESKNPINGTITVKALSQNPRGDVKALDNVFEYCQVQLNNINKDDLKKVSVDIKVRKSWLNDNGVKDDQIALFTIDEKSGNWTAQNTAKKTESSVYFFYSTEGQNFPFWAVAKSNPSFFSTINPGLLLLCCIILLILIIFATLLISSRNRKQNKSSYQS